MPLDVQLEAVLFYKAAPMRLVQLLKLFGVEREALDAAVATLNDRLQGSGVRLLQTDTELQLVTAPELDELIESIRKDELKRDIGKAGAETLAIILYRGPIERAEIDRIRGVNSGFILRNLLVRGLIEREQAGRSYSFNATPMLLAHLGINHKTELPNYATVLDQLERFETEQATETAT